MRKLILPNLFFEDAAEMLKGGKSVMLSVGGESMLPFIRGGEDKIELIPYDASIELPLWCCAFYKWGDSYMVHRYVGMRDEMYRMMGDGNLFRIEEIVEDQIAGVLQYIYHPDGTVQNCLDDKWLKSGKMWYRLRRLRYFLLAGYKLFRPLSCPRKP